jgi:hypothetical protein
VSHNTSLSFLGTHNTVAGVLFTTVFVIAIPLKQMMLQVNRSDKDNGEQNLRDGRRRGSISPKQNLSATAHRSAY